MALLSAFRRWSPLVAHLALAALLNTTLDGPVWAEILRNRPRLERLDHLPAAPAAEEVSWPAVPPSLPERASSEPKGVALPETLPLPEPPSWSPRPVPVLASAQAVQVPSRLAPDTSSSAADQLARIAVLPPVPSPEGDRVPSDGGRPFAGAVPPETAAMGSPALESSPERISLAPGWNLISLPKEPDDVDPAVALSPMSGALEAAHAFDGCNAADPWRVYAPSAPPDVSDLDAVDHRIGVWVQVTGDAALPVTGDEPAETSIQLCQGWNLIGYPLSHPRPVLNALASIAGKFVRVMGYDPTDAEDPWEAFDVGAPAWANDLQTMQPGRGYWVYASEDVSLRMANTGPPPEVSITAPADAATITAPTEIRGTIRSDLLEIWTLEHRLKGESAFTAFASGNVPVTNAVLGSFDPTLLLNGMFEVRLTARDLAGRTASVAINLVTEGNLKIGYFTLSFTDLDVPVAGLPIQVIRTYDSRDKLPGDFGVGWRLSLSDVRLQETGSPGQGWRGVRIPGLLPNYCILPAKVHIVTITLPNGTVAKFRPKITPECQAVVPPQFVTVSYVPLPGTLGTLAPLDHDGRSLVIGGFPGEVELWDQDKTILHDPDRYQLTGLDGRALTIAQGRGLSAIKDRNGNTLTVGRNGIVHSSGQGIAFQRDDQGRIHKIVDPMGNALGYTYDAFGNLRSYSDREGETSNYTYGNNHDLISIADPRGNRPLRNDYDEHGRLMRHTDAFGRTIDFAHKVGARQELVTDRMGHSRLLEYDQRGNIVREVDENGSVTTRTFDARNNILSETDALGNTTSFTYDTYNNLTKRVDPLGNQTTYTYNARGQVLTTTGPRGRTITYRYDSRGNMASSDDPQSTVISATYDARGNLLSRTDAEGAVTQYEYDRFGNLVKEVLPLGNASTYTYDASGNRTSQTVTRTTRHGIEVLTATFKYDRLGRLIETTDPSGAVSRVAYDSAGKVLERIDPLGRRTTYIYDEMGRVTEERFPDDRTEKSSYDPEGRMLSRTDRAGRTTRYEYDARGNLTKTTYPDGALTLGRYDPVGRLISSTDARGNTTSYEYDAAGRRTRIVDALGHAMVFVYDENGNKVSERAGNGHETSFEYDDANRLVRVVLPDGTSRTQAYDRLGRKISETDTAGRVTRFDYDAAGQLIGVTNALGQSTRYSYDETGKQISQTDANGNTTTFEHDRAGRLIHRAMPLGQAESFTYDLVGNIASRTDFNGNTVTYEYDASDRLARRLYADGSIVSFSYTATGKRASASDSRGTVAYSYDSRDRVSRVTYPDGRELAYEYDLQGNRTKLSVVVGAGTFVTRYTYDRLNRLETVQDPMGRVYSHAYDPIGNRASVAYPNLVETSYSYDVCNRLTGLLTRSAANPVIQSYSYQLDAQGNRARIEENDGTVRQYTYDAVARVTAEVVSRDGSVASEDFFEYDSVGNRVTRRRTADGKDDMTPYVYDARDRLLAAGDVTYDWDSNGSLVGRSGADSGRFGWSLENQLAKIELADGTVIHHDYDVDGNRIRSEVISAAGSTAITEYLIDPSHVLSSGVAIQGFSQVVAETDASGALTAFYVRGDDLLAVIRPGGTRFYHPDGLGSIRVLSDENAMVTDRYAFSAFGELLGHSGSDPNAYLFAGEQADLNSGFYYLRARWMEPASGRFVSMDPFSGITGEPHSLHKYLYAMANPVNVTDPSGQHPWWLIIMLLGSKVHHKIGEHFMAQQAGRLANYYPIFSILQISPTACRPVAVGCLLKPDLTDLITGEVYEIKPVGHFAAIGYAQLIVYLGLLNASDPRSRFWYPGVTYGPPPTLTIPDYGGWHVIVYPPVVGVIEYLAFPSAEMVGAGVAAVSVVFLAYMAASVAFAQLKAMSSIPALVRI